MEKVMMILMVFSVLIIAGCSSNNMSGLSTEDSGDSVSVQSVSEEQVVVLGLDQGGYLPREITVSLGVPVVLKNDGSLAGCGLYPSQPELGINANFAKDEEFRFTPQKKGSFTFSCSMGMFKGVINVV